jgi:hypothetical protein
MGDEVFLYSSSKFSANFKTIFQKPTDIALNLSTPYRSRVRKSHDFTGSDKTGSVSLSLGGGRGSGSTLPNSNQRTVAASTLSKIETHGKYIMDRKTIIAGSDEKGSFSRSEKMAVKGVVESVNLNIERMCFGSNSLGTIDTGGVTDNGDGTYDLVISSATWIQANFLKGDYVNIESGNTDQFEITSITNSSRTVVVSRITGSQVPAAADEIFLQGSENNELVSYADVFDSGVSAIHGITKQAGWQGTRVNGASATISMDLLADLVIDIHQDTGRAATEIHASVGQYKNLLASVQEPQYYIGVAKHGEYKMSYKGLSLLSPVSNEELPVFMNRFIHNTKVYVINNEDSELCFAPRFGWFEEGPQRITGTTQYEYPYGGELAHFIHPSYQGEIHTLAE